jgi:HD-GYP domain-containing protein (c-di-GMP phosphodiesterase class II)
MSAPDKDQKLQTFYRNFLLGFVGAIRALSLYPPEHPEIQKKTGNLFQGLSKYLNLRNSLTLLFMRGDVVIENTPFPDLSNTLAQVLQRFQAMNLQRLVFQRGLTADELLRFLQLLLKLLKNPEKADVSQSMTQQQLPHISAGILPLDPTAQVSYEELSSILEDAGQATFSVSNQLKDLFADLESTLPAAKVTMAQEMVSNIFRMVVGGEVPLKVIIYRRSPESDPYLHAFNVCALSMSLAQQLEFQEEMVLEIGLAALLHDIGYHLFPPLEPSDTATITVDEKKRQWEHPIRGAKMLAATPDLPVLVPIVAYEHHLHYDGGGYPPQERPRQLNLASLITSITSSFDRLRESRPGHTSLSLADSIHWMDRKVGMQFHPVVFKKFRNLVKAQSQEEI